MIADPSDLSLVSLVTQICSCSAVGTTERVRETERKKESTFRGSGAETNTETPPAPAVGLLQYFIFVWSKWGL